MRIPAIAFLTALLAVSTGPVYAQDAKPAVISVSATGKANVVPDLAILYLNVLREADTAREALDANNAAMAAVLKAMKDAGVEDRDLQTSNFSIQPKYSYPKASSSRNAQRIPKIEGYTVSNALTVRIREMGKVGEVLDKSVTLGVNSGGGITFTTDDPTKALEEARAKAVERAIAKAKTLSQSAGVSLGKILEISELNRGVPQPRRLARTALAESAAAVPVASGENTYQVTVNIRWEIVQ